MDLAEAIAGSLHTQDEADGRIYGFQVGAVTDVSDDKALGRVKARIGAMSAGQSSDWLIPMWPGGIEAVPNVGDPVLVGFIDGDPNRGFYCYAPTTKTQKRATQAMILGTTFVGLFNYLVAQFNQLRADYNVFAVRYSGHNHNGTTASLAVTEAASTTGASDAVKGKAWDGSTVPNVSSASVVLSGQAMVRGGDAPPATSSYPLIPPHFRKSTSG